MADSTDMFGDPIPGNDPQAQPEPAPSAAELEAAGQVSLFGDPLPAPKAAPAAVEPVPALEPAPQPELEPDPEPEAAPVIEVAPVIEPVARAIATAPVPPPAAPAASLPRVTAQPYRVLARKYRPQTFSELIGQDAMVQTLANAIRRDRLAHAFLMTGVRGVGKTSTARLIAKALNCVGPDGAGGPTIDPCGQCEPCTAIAEGRHIDVIEMDAASNTGVDDVREIIEAVRYAAVSARYKIYIIDEVHMLSRNAFNALLKTLEEPPAHVKFLFATTEVDKLPVTVLSRCQRFDLRRIPTPLLASHFGKVCEAEGVAAEDEALHMVAAAAEGSVRDGLSILDQAIAHADLGGDGTVTAEQVREMLGLADKSAQRRVFAALLAGDGAALLDLIAAQFALGIEPVALVRGAMDVTHKVTVAQLGKGLADAVSAEERDAVEGWAKALSAGQLHRLWQLLLKGFDEVRTAPDPLVAAQMALLRVMHASDMPDPGSLVKKLEELASRAPAVVGMAAGDSGEHPSAMMSAATGGQGAPFAAPAVPASAIGWQELVDHVDHAGQLRVAQIMRDWVRVVRIAPGELHYTLAPGMAVDPAADMRDAIYQSTGQRWNVERVEGEGTPTLREVIEAAKAADEEALRRSPLVEAAFAAFPKAEIVEDEPVERNWRRA